MEKILADERFENLHASATGLRSLVRLRLHPKERLHELARVLTNKKQNDNLKQDLWDYTTLLDQYLESSDANQRAAAKGDDLTDWIATIESPDGSGLNFALERWQATRADTWLIAALSQVEASHEKTGELISHALNVKPTAAAFASARFHAVRLLMESGKNDEARTLVGRPLRHES